MANLVEKKEVEKVKEVMKKKEVLPGLETPDSTKPSFFKMRSGNSPMFKYMGSSPAKAINMEAIIGASKSAEERVDMSDVYEGLAEDAQKAMVTALGQDPDKDKDKDKDKDDDKDDDGDTWA